MNLNYIIPLYETVLDIGLLDIIWRLLCALLVGIVIGTEREYTHRPAGMRTHMLVSLGACVVMIIGQLIFVQYREFDATPDPARMAAQVITGVGFLGAGTILREGTSVKGLTTAASLWSTACLGLAAGAGYYILAVAGMLFIFATLTIFEVIQKKLIGSQKSSETYEISTSNISACLSAINQVTDHGSIAVENLQVHCKEPKDTYIVQFRADFTGPKPDAKKRALLERLLSTEGTASVHVLGEFAGKL